MSDDYYLSDVRRAHEVLREAAAKLEGTAKRKHQQRVNDVVLDLRTEAAKLNDSLAVRGDLGDLPTPSALPPYFEVGEQGRASADRETEHRQIGKGTMPEQTIPKSSSTDREGKAPHPDSIPKLPQPIFNFEGPARQAPPPPPR